MGTSKTCNLPARLERLQQRFEQSRRVRKARSRIPNSLWAAAVTMAKTYGVNRTARALRLDYYSLKKRIERAVVVDHGFAVVPAGLPQESAAAAFVELAPPASAVACDCTVELENAAGAKMRVHWKGVEAPDLAALSRSFWNPAS
jgi:hypothetical protein